MSSKGTILITGLNGYLAGRVAETALKAGYHVRGTVRNLTAGAEAQKALQDLGYGGGTEVVQVSDMTEPGAFDQAVIGCTAIIHLAAPVDAVFKLQPPAVVAMAKAGTKSILESASRAGPQLRTLVLMSSVAAVFNVLPEPGVYTEKDWNTNSEKAIEDLGAEAGFLHAYCASKTASERMFWRFKEEQKPQFSMTAIQATYFLGPPLVPWKTAEQVPISLTNLFNVLQGKALPESMFLYEGTIDIRDVARVILWSVQNPEKANGERYLCSSARGGPQAIADILNKHMPQVGAVKGNPGQGYKPGYPPTDDKIAFDGSKAVQATGQGYIPYETSVLDTAKVLLQLLGK
ncbi:hypothetical protein M426DRAFT_15973 [Hypoxylon sp. CI-4A]|nr:hypothetical protein M426DRAFT_15973 [Hypoxylon sp. CI-4A]